MTPAPPITMQGPLTDVTVRACPDCRRLVCGDWRTCPGYLRQLMARLENERNAA